MSTHKPLLAPFYLIAATFIGIADTLYLSYYHYLGITPGCALKGCEMVLNSPYATPFGVPFAYIGMVYYVYMLALALLVAYDPYSRALRLGTLVYTGIGLACSICFELIQIFVIGAICVYCGMSALTTLILFSLAVWYYKSTR